MDPVEEAPDTRVTVATDTRVSVPETPDPEALYEATSSYSFDNKVIQQGTRLRGDHPEVRARFGRWMLADLPDDEKQGFRNQALYGRRMREGDWAPRQEDPIAQPPSGRFRALRSWTIADPDLKYRARINAGDIVDAADELYKRFPHLFVQYLEDR